MPGTGTCTPAYQEDTHLTAPLMVQPGIQQRGQAWMAEWPHNCISSDMAGMSACTQARIGQC